MMYAYAVAAICHQSDAILLLSFVMANVQNYLHPVMNQYPVLGQFFKNLLFPSTPNRHVEPSRS